MNGNSFYDLSIQKVKNACEKYWLDKDASYFISHLFSEDAPIIGMDMADEDGFYKIEKAIYKGSVQQDDLCVVIAELVVYDTEKVFILHEQVNLTVTCVQKEDKVYFASVHMAAAKQKLIALDGIKGPGFYYKQLMKNMCDLLIEARAFEDGFSFDEEKYFDIFHEKRQFTSMDQWFWHLCENFVVEQDLEKLDLFRESDLKKRVEKEELLIDTTFRINRDDGIVWLQMVVVLLVDATGASLGEVFVMLKDCTREMNEKMKNLEFARTDYLTGICNRRYTEEIIGERIENKKNGIFILFDIDKFKDINDTFGHITGDELLIKMSQKVGKHLGKLDIFGRLGGDEFILWLEGSEDVEADKARIWEVFESTKFRHTDEDVDIQVHSSAGVVFYSGEDTSFEELYEKADKAMYQAKGAGRNSIVIA